MSFPNKSLIAFLVVFNLLILSFSCLVIADEKVEEDGSISAYKEVVYQYQYNIAIEKGQQLTLYLAPIKLFLKLVVEKQDGTFFKETEQLVFDSGDISATFITELAPGDYNLKAKYRIYAKIGATGMGYEYLYLPTVEDDLYKQVIELCGTDDSCYESFDPGRWYFISNKLTISDKSKYKINIQAEVKELEAIVDGDFRLQKEYPGIIESPIYLNLKANREINQGDNIIFDAEYKAKIIQSKFDTVKLIPPEIIILSPSEVIPEKENITFRVEIIDVDGEINLNSIYFFIDGKRIVPEKTSGDIYEYILSKELVNIGSHMFRISVEDKEGNVSIAEKEFKVDPYALDDTPPDKLTTTPVSDESGTKLPVTSHTKPFVSITVEDESGIDTESISSASLKNTSTNTNIPVQTEYIIKNIESGEVRIDLIYSDKLNDGNYKATVEVKDSAGNPGTFFWEFAVDSTLEDNSPPIVELVKPFNGAKVKPADDGTVEVELDVFDESGISNTVVNIFDANDNPLVLEGKNTYYLINTTSDGIYSLTVNATDDSINKNSTIESFNFTVDSEPPIVRVDAPENGEVVPTETPGMAGYVEPNDVANEQAIEVFIDDKAADFTYIHYGLVNIKPQELADKTEHEVRIIASDQAGNMSKLVQGVNLVKFTVDTDEKDITAPAVPIQSVYPKPDSVISTTELSQIEFIAADSSGISEVWIEINGWLFQLSELQNNNIQQNRSHYTVSLNRTLMLLGEQQDDVVQSEGGGFQFDPIELGTLEKSFKSGKNSITLKVTDKAGNNTNQSWDFFVVTESPKAPVLDEVTEFTNTKNLTVTGTVAEFSSDNPVKVSLRLNGVVVRTPKVDENENFSAKDVILVNGYNHITAIAIDSAGNHSNPSTPVEVILDISPPQINLDEMPATTDSSKLTVSGLITDNTEIASISLILNDESQSLGNEKEFSTEVELVDGQNSIQIKAEDIAGNVSMSAKILVEAKLYPWDVNKDDVIDIFDLVLVGKHFGENAEDGDAWDVNKDGIIDIFDLVLVGKHFGETYGETSASPVLTSTENLSNVNIIAERVDSRLKVALQISNQQSAITRLSGFQFEMQFDAKQLKLIDIKEGNALNSSNSTETYCLEPEIETDSVRFASVLLNDKSDSLIRTSKAFLTEMNFEVKGNLDDALKSIKVKDIKLSDSEGRLIPFELSNMVKLISNKRKLRNALLPNYPNPFNPETWIPYSIAKDSTVTVRIYNLLGQTVRKLDIGFVKAGEYLSKDKAVYWDGKNKYGEQVASGIYFYQINVNSDDNKFTEMRRLVILK